MSCFRPLSASCRSAPSWWRSCHRLAHAANIARSLSVLALASWTFRAISRVAAPCSSTAVAMEAVTPSTSAIVWKLRACEGGASEYCTQQAVGIYEP
jgi:hypothetical protein